MLALSVRQPYAEQILRGLKRVEYRGRPTRVRGRVYLYAALKPGDPDEFERLGKRVGELPTGVVIGTVEITGCSGGDGRYVWHLAKPLRLKRPRKPERHPQPLFFYPFD